MKIPKNLHFIRGARKLASLKQPPLLFLIKLDFLHVISIRPFLLADLFNPPALAEEALRKVLEIALKGANCLSKASFCALAIESAF